MGWNTETFTTVGEISWTIPDYVYNLTIECWGSAGMGDGNNNAGSGGDGGYVKGEYNSTPGDTLTLRVGGYGDENAGKSRSVTHGGGFTAVKQSGSWIIGAGGGGGGGYSNAADGDVGDGGDGGGVATDGSGASYLQMSVDGGVGGAASGNSGGDGEYDGHYDDDVYGGGGGGGFNGGTGGEAHFIDDGGTSQDDGVAGGGGGGDGYAGGVTNVEQQVGVRSGEGKIEITYYQYETVDIYNPNTSSFQTGVIKIPDGNSWTPKEPKSFDGSSWSK